MTNSDKGLSESWFTPDGLESVKPSTIYVVSGPDRAGKTQWINTHKSANDTVIHSGPIPPTLTSFDYHSQPIVRWLKERKSKNADLYLDRSYVCTYLLDTLRHGLPNSNLRAVTVFEMFLDLMPAKVKHIGLTPIWSQVARRHVEELYEGPQGSEDWLCGEYEKRMLEHKGYVEGLRTFYKHVTMFPHQEVGG